MMEVWGWEFWLQSRDCWKMFYSLKHMQFGTEWQTSFLRKEHRRMGSV